MRFAIDEELSYPYFEDVNWGLLRLWGSRSGRQVLDVGCGYATTTARLQKLGNDVTGIESSAEAVTVARQRIGHVVSANLLDFDRVRAELSGHRFDTIVFADVLEHLPWPVSVLRQYLQLLAPGGRVIVSLPNVGLWSVRLSLLTGRFDYAETGVLDRSHLRFFTRRSAGELLQAAGLEALRTVYNPGLVRPFVPLVKRLLAPRNEGAADPSALLESRPYRAYLKSVYPLERAVARLWPGLLAFQFVIESAPKETA